MGAADQPLHLENIAEWRTGTIRHRRTIQDLIGEYIDHVERKASRWDLSERNIEPRGMGMLFEHIAGVYLEHEPTYLLMVDLAGNRLLNASVAEYCTVFRALDRCGQLAVRFGYDNFIPTLEQAKAEMGANENSWHERVFLDVPWIAQQRTQVQLQRTQVQLDTLAKSVEKFTTSVSGWKKNMTTSMEDEAAMALVEALDMEKSDKEERVYGAVSLPQCRKLYVSKEPQVEFDGVVSGKHNGEPVLVLLEAKTRACLEAVDRDFAKKVADERLTMGQISKADAAKLVRKCMPNRVERYKDLMERSQSTFQEAYPGKNRQEARLLGGQQWVAFEDILKQKPKIICAVAALVFDKTVEQFCSDNGYWVVKFNGARFTVVKPNMV